MGRRRLAGVSSRNCSKTACSQPAVATLTFVYADSTAVIGPLSTEVNPHGYDLCARHAASFTAPNGWTVLMAPAPLRPEDDHLALAKALADDPTTVDRARFSGTEQRVNAQQTDDEPRHLRVVRGVSNDG